MVGNSTPMNLKQTKEEIFISMTGKKNIQTHRNIANSIGLMSTKCLTITEHSEKNSDESVASKMPKYGHLAAMLCSQLRMFDL